jgi:hypothetical protein
MSLDVAARLIALMTQSRDANALRAMLAPEVRFVALARNATGPGQVATELLDGPTGELARKLDWAPPQQVGDTVRLTTTRKPGAADRELVLTLHFAGDRIALVQQQRQAAPPPRATTLVLPEALRRMLNDALVERHPMLMAYVGPDGQPVLSYRGSVQVDGDDRLAMWIRNPEGLFVRSIRANPKVALMYRNEETKATYQFQGRARVSDSQGDRRRVFAALARAEHEHDFAMLGVVVLVDLDRVEGYAGLGPGGQVDGIRMLRDAGAANLSTTE